jgi:hypothetical protein
MRVSSPAADGMPGPECSTANASAAAATIRSPRRAGRPCRMRAGTSRAARHVLTCVRVAGYARPSLVYRAGR